MCNFSSCRKGGVPAIPDIICLFSRHEIEARSPSAHCNREIMKHYSFPSIPFSFSPLYCPGWRARVCPWAFHKLLEIFQTASCNFSKTCSNVTSKKVKTCSWKQKRFLFWCENMQIVQQISEISKHFCAILRRNQRYLITLSSIKTEIYNEPIKLLNDLLHLRHSSQSNANLNFL